MNYDNDINLIRTLLEKYYRGETRPEEERQLETFFSESAAEDIPEDMVADGKLFAGMREIHPLPTEFDVPDGLLEKLNDIMDQPTASNKGHKKIFRFLRYSGIAVAASIIWGIIMLIPWSGGVEPGTNPTFLLEDKQAEASVEKESILTIVKSTSDKYTSIGEAANDAIVERPEREASDGFIEITDPEEAGKIALEIGKLLAFNSDKTNEAMAQICNSIDSYKEITKSVLQ